MSMFHSTLPLGASDLMRVSDFRRYLKRHEAEAEARGTRLSSLTPSLLQDLMRFDRPGQGSDLLEVIAAALRHGRDLLLNLELGDHVVPLTVFPADRLVHCPLTAEQLLSSRLHALRVMQVEPALLPSPAAHPRQRLADAAHYSALGPLTWAMAMRGARDSLLPELVGPVAYRVTHGADLQALALTGTAAAAVARLRRESSNLREITGWPGFDRERAMRLLNGLYLQAALIVSRTHPAATNEHWRPDAAG
jgi:hypothetical protein